MQLPHKYSILTPSPNILAKQTTIQVLLFPVHNGVSSMIGDYRVWGGVMVRPKVSLNKNTLYI